MFTSRTWSRGRSRCVPTERPSLVGCHPAGLRAQSLPRTGRNAEQQYIAVLFFVASDVMWRSGIYSGRDDMLQATRADGRLRCSLILRALDAKGSKSLLVVGTPATYLATITIRPTLKRFRCPFFFSRCVGLQWEIERHAQAEGERSGGKGDAESGGAAGRKSKYLDMVLEVCM